MDALESELAGEEPEVQWAMNFAAGWIGIFEPAYRARCVKLGGFVNGTPEFDQHPAVINGCSDLMVDVFGEAGKHSRFALGAGNLPFNVAVEIDAVFEIT